MLVINEARFLEPPHEKANPRQSLLATTAMLVHQILLVLNVSCQHINPKHIYQLHLLCQCEHHVLLLNSQKVAVCDRAGRHRSERLTGYGILANKILIAQYAESCFLPVGVSADFYRSCLYDKQRISHITLSVNCLSSSEGHHLPAFADG